MKRKLILSVVILLVSFMITQKVLAKYTMTSQTIEIIRIDKLELPDRVFDKISIKDPEVTDTGTTFTITANLLQENIIFGIM